MNEINCIIFIVLFLFYGVYQWKTFVKMQTEVQNDSASGTVAGYRNMHELQNELQDPVAGLLQGSTWHGSALLVITTVALQTWEVSTIWG